MRSGALSRTYGIRLLFEPRVQRVALVCLLIVLVAFRTFQFFYLSGAPQWGYDLSFYWRAGLHVLDGEPIYAPFQLAGPYPPQGVSYEYLYPPFLAVVVAPLAAVVEDYRIANWLWATLGAVILVATVVVIARREHIARGTNLMLLVGAALAYAPVVSELNIGNVHLLILGLLAGAYLGVARRTARGEIAAGILVGIATLIKLFPAVIVIWFLLTGRWRAAMTAFVTMAVLAVATMAVVGIGPWLDYPTVLANLGPPTELTDVLAPAVWLSAVIPPIIAQILVTIIGLGIVVWTSRRRTEAVSFAVAVTVSVLIAPALYPHYLAILVLPLLLALRVGLPAALLLVVFLSASGGGPEVFGDLAWVVNRVLPLAGALALIAGFMWSAGAPDTRRTTTSP